jgi:hypothetical protein
MVHRNEVPIKEWSLAMRIQVLKPMSSKQDRPVDVGYDSNNGFGIAIVINVLKGVLPYNLYVTRL